MSAGKNASDAAPGSSDAAPGSSDAAPGSSDAAPGLSDAAPGLSDAAPGSSRAAPGTFIAVVGPSGAGKDTLIAAAHERLSCEGRLVFPRRWITRRPGERERAEEVGRVELRRRRDDGECALSWEAHGIAYAIPAGVDDEIAAGRTVVANVSRSVLADALARFPRAAAIVVTASRETLAARLAERGRENARDRTRRLARAPRPVPPGMRTVEVPNDGEVGAATERFVEAIGRLAPSP